MIANAGWRKISFSVWFTLANHAGWSAIEMKTVETPSYEKEI